MRSLSLVGQKRGVGGGRFKSKGDDQQGCGASAGLSCHLCASEAGCVHHSEMADPGADQLDSLSDGRMTKPEEPTVTRQRPRGKASFLGTSNDLLGAWHSV